MLRRSIQWSTHMVSDPLGIRQAGEWRRKPLISPPLPGLADLPNPSSPSCRVSVSSNEQLLDRCAVFRAQAEKAMRSSSIF